MKIDRLTIVNKPSFTSNSDKKQKRQEYFRDATDACIAIGVLSCDDFLSSATKQKTKMQKFGEMAFVLGAAIITIRFFDKFFNSDSVAFIKENNK